MPRIGLISDTHGYLDPKVFDYFKECDEVWHAGDFGEGVAGQLRNFKPLRGVFGNIDGQIIRSDFPEELFFECGGMKVLMIHIGGSPGHYYPQAKKLIDLHRPSLFICGHSHILKVMHDKNHHMLYMNPGAAGKHGFHKMRTVLRFKIDGKKIENLEAIELGSRGVIESVDSKQ
jgi:putative phosphoesterase